MYFLDSHNFQIAGASTPTAARRSLSKFLTRPIAGAPPRGADQSEDAQARRGLLADEEER